MLGQMSRSVPDSPLEIACDESGNTGENLTSSQHGVFSEGSHDLTVDESSDLLDWVKTQLHKTSAEIKWKDVRADPSLVETLFRDRLNGRAHFYLTEKTYFVVGKVVDLLIEELQHDEGKDLYAGGRAKKLAFDLYRNGHRALGAEQWESLLQDFNSLMRRDSATQRLKAVPKTTVDEFFRGIEVSQWQSRRRNVTDILREIARTKGVADEFVASLDPSTRPIPSLDPLIPSLAQTIRHWYDLHGRKQIAVIHDEGPVPSSTAMTALVDGLRNPGEFRRMTPPVNIKEIRTAESSTDARIQVADLIAGFGAQSGQQALNGRLEHPQLGIAREMISSTSLWGDDKSAALLGLDT